MSKKKWQTGRKYVDKKGKANTTMPCGRGIRYRFNWEIFQVNTQQDKAHGPCSLINPWGGTGALDAGCTADCDPGERSCLSLPYILPFNCISLEQLYIKRINSQDWEHACWKKKSPQHNANLGSVTATPSRGKAGVISLEQAIRKGFLESPLDHSAGHTTKFLQIHNRKNVNIYDKQSISIN